MTDLEPQPGVTDDAFLGDALAVLQPRSGYRAGVDAVLLAAAIADTGRPLRILDAGAGVGVVGLCAARRLPGTHVLLLERQPELVELARQNVARNSLSDRVTAIEGDITARAGQNALPEDAGFDVVVANPPFHVTGHGTTAASPLKAASHAMPGGQLDDWVRFATRALKPGGVLTMIHKADALAELLEAYGRRFGAIRLKPIYARAGEPAIRVLIQGTKGSRAPLDIRAPFILHGGDGHGFTPEAEAILRSGAPLRM